MAITHDMEEMFNAIHDRLEKLEHRVTDHETRMTNVSDANTVAQVKDTLATPSEPVTEAPVATPVSDTTETGATS